VPVLAVELLEMSLCTAGRSKYSTGVLGRSSGELWIDVVEALRLVVGDASVEPVTEVGMWVG